ncbi:RNA pyrophosphohydrolase [compost metagenome]
MTRKRLSCGVLLLNERQELFLAHVTGHPQWDIPKGCADPGEPALAAALRETFEETGIRLPPEGLLDLGRHGYQPEKDLHLFRAQVASTEVDPASCRCTSFFIDPRTGAEAPEVDAFRWVGLSEVPQLTTARFWGVIRPLLPS